MRDWTKHATNYVTKLYAELGYYNGDVQSYVYEHRSNPIIDALKNDADNFVGLATRAGGKSGINLLGCGLACTLAQMFLYDLVRGPDGDGKLKGARRQWYGYFKQFSQLLAFATDRVKRNDQGVLEMIDVQWSGRMSQIYTGLVEDPRNNITFKDLWVNDASRRMEILGQGNQLIPGLAMFLFVEKDSLYEDFIGAGRAAGMVAVGSGKGVPSFAAAEKMIRDAGWSEDYNPFENQVVLIVHLSDYDKSGRGVIGPAFANQLKRYLGTSKIGEGRIGVEPIQVQEVYINAEDVYRASYKVKLSNAGYRSWADEYALFWATCSDCGHETYVVGVDDLTCEKCGAEMVIDNSEAHGFEVESLRTSVYYRAVAVAILQLINFSSLVRGLRIKARPRSNEVVSGLVDELLADKILYQKIDKAVDILEAAKSELRDQIENFLGDPVGNVLAANRDEMDALQDDPEPVNFIDYVENNSGRSYAYPWQPFSRSDRIEYVQGLVKDNNEIMEQARAIKIDNYDEVVSDINDELS